MRDGTVSITNTDSFSNDEGEYIFQLDNQGNIVDIFSQDGDCEDSASLDYDNNNGIFKRMVFYHEFLCDFHHSKALEYL